MANDSKTGSRTWGRWGGAYRVRPSDGSQGHSMPVGSSTLTVKARSSSEGDLSFSDGDKPERLKFSARRFSFQKKPEYDDLYGVKDEALHDWWDELLVIHPNSQFNFVWTMLLIAALVYVAISVPLVMCFRIDPHVAWKTFDACVDVYFIIDFVMNFFVGYTEKDGAVVMVLKSTSYNYLTSIWFPLDLVTSIPFDWISNSLSGVASIRMVKVLRGLRALKMVRLSRTLRGTAMEVIEDLLMTSASVRFAIKIIKLGISMGFVVHWCCCLWHVVVNAKGESWLREYTAWPIDESTDRIPAQTRYLTSLYFVITTMSTVGYGDVVSQTTGERKAALLCMVVGGACYGLLIGNMVSIVGQAELSDRLYHSRMESILAYMVQRRFPVALQKKIKSYYKRLFETSVQKETTLLGELSVSLQNEVALFMLDGLVFQNPTFKYVTKKTLAVVVDTIQPRVHGADEVIAKEGDLMVHMFIISSGYANVRSVMRSERSETLSRGDSFGDECLARDKLHRWNATVTSMDVTDCMVISSEDLFAALQRVYRNGSEVERALVDFTRGAASFKTLSNRWKVKSRKPSPSKRKVTLQSLVKKQMVVNSMRNKKKTFEMMALEDGERLENSVLRCAKRMHARHDDDAHLDINIGGPTMETLHDDIRRLKLQMQVQADTLNRAVQSINKLVEHVAPPDVVDAIRVQAAAACAGEHKGGEDDSPPCHPPPNGSSSEEPHTPLSPSTPGTRGEPLSPLSERVGDDAPATPDSHAMQARLRSAKSHRWTATNVDEAPAPTTSVEPTQAPLQRDDTAASSDTFVAHLDEEVLTDAPEEHRGLTASPHAFGGDPHKQQLPPLRQGGHSPQQSAALVEDIL